MRRVLIAVLFCAVIFGILATWIGPNAISYWYRPPTQSGVAAQFNCDPDIKWAMGRLVWTQIWGTLGGALVGLIFGIVLRPHRGPKAAAAGTKTTTTAGTPPTTPPRTP